MRFSSSRFASKEHYDQIMLKTAALVRPLQLSNVEATRYLSGVPLVTTGNSKRSPTT